MKRFQKRPEVSIENFPAVFDYYDSRGPNPAFARLGHYAMSKVYKPRIGISKEAIEGLRFGLGTGRTALVIMKHVNDLDQYNLASCVQLEPALNPLIGKTQIMAKIPKIFDKPGAVGWMRRRAVDGLGAFPVVRNKDEADGATDEEKKMRRIASDMSLELGLNTTARDGYNLALFPEKGGREEGEDKSQPQPRLVRPLSHGLGEIYGNLLDQGKRPMIIPIGQFVGDDEFEKRYKQPDIYIGCPIRPEDVSADQVTEMAHAMLQWCVDRAVEQREYRG